MPFVEIETKRVHYLHRPGGLRPIVFLHGGFGSSAELWEIAMAALPPEYSAYAIDNFLRSEAPASGYTVDAFAERAAAFVAALDLRSPVLVGHSMGGVVCQIAALRHPHLFRALALVCTGARTANLGLAHRLLDDLRRNRVDLETMRAVSANWFHRDLANGFFEAYVARAATAPLEAMITAQESHIATDLRAQLGRIDVPVLVVWGRHDTGRTFDHAQTLLDGIRGSSLAVMEHSGHSPMVETPEDFNAALLEFLDRVFQRAAA